MVKQNRRAVNISLPPDLHEWATERGTPLSKVLQAALRVLQRTGAVDPVAHLESDDGADELVAELLRPLDLRPAGPHPWTQTGHTRWVARVEPQDVPRALAEAERMGLVIEMGSRVPLSARRASEVYGD